MGNQLNPVLVLFVFLDLESSWEHRERYIGRVWGGKSREECRQDVTLYCLESLVSGP